MNKKQIISFIEDRPWIRAKGRLERMEVFLKALDNPHKKLKYIHVAGTNGKGSACAMLTSILMEKGYRVGTFTSPHLVEYNERFCINNKAISDKDLGLVIKEVKKACGKLDFVPSVFETLSAIGFTYFAKEKVDIVVLEVGMGGRFDATNVIDKSEVSLLMSIGLEHTEILGDTLEKIAYEKAGIIKENGNVVAYDNPKEVLRVFEQVAKEKHAKLKEVNFKQIKIIKEGLNGQIFDYGKLKNIELNLLGKHQFYNAAVVIEAVNILNKKGYGISVKNLRDGLRNVIWDARLSILSKDPLFILDGAHNPQCAVALKNSLPKILGKRKAIMLYGTLADKDYLSVIDMMGKYAKEFICLTPNSNRALKANKLAKIIKGKGYNACYTKDALSGIKRAYKDVENNDVILAFGSLYLAGEIKDAFNSYIR